MENNKKLTAVEWLADQIMHPQLFNPYIEEAKKIEKQQIIDALHYFGIEKAEKYYEKTFKNK
jgi:hypothetical protein